MYMCYLIYHLKRTHYYTQFLEKEIGATTFKVVLIPERYYQECLAGRLPKWPIGKQALHIPKFGSSWRGKDVLMSSITGPEIQSGLQNISEGQLTQ